MTCRRTDSVVGRSLGCSGEFFGQEVALFRQCVRAVGRVIGVGASIGAHTVAPARPVGPAGRVLPVTDPDSIRWCAATTHVFLEPKGEGEGPT